MMCQLASVEATYPKCGGGVPDPPPVLGKCATRTFSSNLYWASVLLALSRQNGQCYVSLISRGVRPGYSRAYISLYYVRAQSHALLARIMPARDIETRPRDVLKRPPGALPPDPRPCRGLVLGLMLSRSHFGVLDGSIYPCGMGGMGLPLLRVGYRGDMGCTQRSQPTCVINRLPTDLDARSTLRKQQSRIRCTTSPSPQPSVLTDTGVAA